MHFATRTRPMAASFQSALTLDHVRRIAPSAFATQAHESRSSRYTYIPTSDILIGLDRQGFKPFLAAQSRSRIEGKSEFTKHMIRLRHVDAMAVNGVYPEVILVNAHDGTSAYKLLAGLFVLVCTNGHISGETTGELAVQHKGNIVHNVIEGSFQIIEQAKQALHTSDDWNRLQLTNGEQRAFAHAAHVVRFGDSDGNVNTPITPDQLLQPRRHEDRGNSLWKTFNVVQENVVRGGLSGTRRTVDETTGRTTRRRVTTRTVNGIDQDVKLNRALWTLAQEMAKLK